MRCRLGWSAPALRHITLRRLCNAPQPLSRHRSPPIGCGGAFLSRRAQASGSATCIDGEPNGTRWHSVEQTERLAGRAVAGLAARRSSFARASGERAVGALFRRTRPDGAGGVRVQAEARFDGLAGCLRTGPAAARAANS